MLGENLLWAYYNCVGAEGIESWRQLRIDLVKSLPNDRKGCLDMDREERQEGHLTVVVSSLYVWTPPMEHTPLILFPGGRFKYTGYVH
jgi:hypothetical protein